MAALPRARTSYPRTDPHRHTPSTPFNNLNTWITPSTPSTRVSTHPPPLAISPAQDSPPPSHAIQHAPAGCSHPLDRAAAAAAGAAAVNLALSLAPRPLGSRRRGRAPSGRAARRAKVRPARLVLVIRAGRRRRVLRRRQTSRRVGRRVGGRSDGGSRVDGQMEGRWTVRRRVARGHAEGRLARDLGPRYRFPFRLRACVVPRGGRESR